jgi:hypothetical protein
MVYFASGGYSETITFSSAAFIASQASSPLQVSPALLASSAPQVHRPREAVRQPQKEAGEEAHQNKASEEEYYLAFRVGGGLQPD